METTAPHASKGGDSPPITFENLNIRTVPVRVQLTFFGKIRAFNTFTVLEWVYLTFSVLALLATLGLTIERLVNHGRSNSSDFTFGILLIVTSLFCGYYVVHAMFTERGDELTIFVISNVIVLIYCVANFIISKNRTTIKLARLVIVSIMSTFLLVVGIYQSLIYCRSNNLIVNTVGTLPEFQKACKMFYWCSSLLKFDLQLQLNMVILVMGPTGAHMDTKQAVILGTGIVITLIFITLGFLGLRRESNRFMIPFYIISCYEPAYIVYKFYYAANEDTKDSATYASTFACGSFSIVVWILLMVSTGNYMAKYFGLGLKEQMFSDVTSPTSSTRPVASSPEDAVFLGMWPKNPSAKLE